MIAPLREAVPEACGAKASSLGLLLRAGFRVPVGFVLTFDEYRAHGRSGSGALPDDVRRALAAELSALGDGPVAVRSSALGEDGVRASSAGQHESFLGVQGVDEVADAVRACWASLESPRVHAYRGAHPHSPSSAPAMAVIVQRMVDAEVSGVMFTPETPDGFIRIEASWGLGPSVVAGIVTPDRYTVGADGTIDRVIADKVSRLDRKGASLVTSSVSERMRTQPALDDATAARLASFGREIAGTLGAPQDVEWAMSDDALWVLQSRPITAVVPPTPASTMVSDGAGSATAEGEPAGCTLTGTPASGGTATGVARIVRGPDDFGLVCLGDILVCPYTDPAWTPLLRLVAGVITEVGGVLSHAAIVAREHRIPAVLGVEGATGRIRAGSIVLLDGDQGTVDLRGEG